jgi:hypothetical protein
MLKRTLAWAIALGCCVSSWGSAWVSKFYVGPYVARDEMDWKLPEVLCSSLSGQDLTVLDELKWKPLWNLGAQGGFLYSVFHPSILFRGDGQIGAILSGDLTETEWTRENFRTKISEGVSSSRGWTAAGQLMAGLRIPGNTVSWAPSIGVDGACLSLHQHGLNQLWQLNTAKLRELVNPSNALQALDGDFLGELLPGFCEEGRISAYHVQWAGPLAALTLWIAPQSPMTAELHGWYSLARYSAEGDWCMKDIYQSPQTFCQKASIQTWSAQFSIQMQLLSSLGLIVQVGARHTWSGHTDTAIALPNGATTCGSFQELSWKRYWGTVAIAYGF